MKFIGSLGFLVLYMLCYTRLVQSDSCAVNFQGLSSVRLSAEATQQLSNSFGNYSIDYTQHTFDLWMNPNQFVAEEQSVFQTGQVLSNDGTSWALEFKIKLTIWQKGQSKPSSSVLYVDVWTMSHEGTWSKARHYIILAEDSYPWLHVVYTPADSNSITVNGKSRRLDQYTTLSSSEIRPNEYMAIGGQYKGAVADLKVWKTAPIESSECSAPIGSNMLVYFPFNECAGDSFSGYINGEEACALMYGSYATDAIWKQTSPEIDSCKPSALNHCASATRASFPATSNGQTGYSRLWLPVGYKTMMILPILIIAVVVLRRYSVTRTNPSSVESLQV